MDDFTLAHHDTLPGRDPIGEAVRRAFDGFRLEYRLGEGGMGVPKGITTEISAASRRPRSTR